MQETISLKKQIAKYVRNLLLFVLVIGGTAFGIYFIIEFKDFRAWKERQQIDTQSLLLTGERPSPDNFSPSVALERQPVVTGFRIVEAGEADELLDEKELVLGVTINGKSRAYPINMMTGPSREIINDELGDRQIAATW